MWLTLIPCLHTAQHVERNFWSWPGDPALPQVSTQSSALCAQDMPSTALWLPGAQQVPEKHCTLLWPIVLAIRSPLPTGPLGPLCSSIGQVPPLAPWGIARCHAVTQPISTDTLGHTPAAERNRTTQLDTRVATKPSTKTTKTSAYHSINPYAHDV